MTPIKQTKLYIARNVHDFLKRLVKMNKDDIIVIDLIDILINWHMNLERGALSPVTKAQNHILSWGIFS